MGLPGTWREKVGSLSLSSSSASSSSSLSSSRLLRNKSSLIATEEASLSQVELLLLPLPLQWREERKEGRKKTRNLFFGRGKNPCGCLQKKEERRKGKAIVPPFSPSLCCEILRKGNRIGKLGPFMALLLLLPLPRGRHPGLLLLPRDFPPFLPPRRV